MQAIRLEGVTRRFGDFTAVDDVDLEIEQGEFFSLLGPSGCGKTTTLRMLAGFDVPTEGSILLEGEPVEDVPPNKRNVNMVFQNYALFDHLDVKGNIAFGLKRKRVPSDEVRQRVGEALELVDLSSRGDSRPSQLSGGQRQRVALARALVNRPRVLLLDEPLGALDLKLRRQMQVELKAIQREVGITFVYVTHDQEEALSMSDRIAVMSQGRVVQCGPPEDIYEHPREEFVAGFIGISNLLSGTAEGRSQVKVGDICLPVPDLPASYGPGDSVQIAVRPEKIAVDEVGIDSRRIEADMFQVEGEIESMVYLGIGNQLTLKLAGGGRVVALEQATYRVRSDDQWRIGQRVQLGWHPEQLHGAQPQRLTHLNPNRPDRVDQRTAIRRPRNSHSGLRPGMTSPPSPTAPAAGFSLSRCCLHGGRVTGSAVDYKIKRGRRSPGRPGPRRRPALRRPGSARAGRGFPRPPAARRQRQVPRAIPDRPLTPASAG